MPSFYFLDVDCLVIFVPLQLLYIFREMNRDTIDFENGRVGTLFRRILIPTLLGSLAISAVTAIDGIFIGHGVGADGVAAVNIVVPIYQIMSGLGLMVGAGCSVVSSIHVGRRKVRAARMNVTKALILSSCPNPATRPRWRRCCAAAY